MSSDEGDINFELRGGQLQGIAGAKFVNIEGPINFYGSSQKHVSVGNADTQLSTCPYPGLSFFGPNEAHNFFGRESAIDRLIEEVTSNRLTVLVGPSGVGKSSLVLAGLAPYLASRASWLFSHYRIGTEVDSNPFLALSRALVPLYQPNATFAKRLKEANELCISLESRKLGLKEILAACRGMNKGEKILLIADQFEETFSLIESDELRKAYIDTLLAGFTGLSSRDSQFSLIVTMRGDFYGRALQNRRLADAMQDRVVNLAPMKREELRRCIVEPARRAGCQFEPALVEVLLNAVDGEPGALPQLQFVMRDLWPTQTNRTIKLESYSEIKGGVAGALARRAEDLYSDIVEKDKLAETGFRRLFNRLVQPNELQGYTRRVARHSELGEMSWSLAQLLADQDNRILVTSATRIGIRGATLEAVELAHEALIDHWPALADWISQDQQFQKWLQQIEPTLKYFLNNRADVGVLLRGGLLDQALEWRKKRGEDLSTDECEYIDVSVAAQESEEEIRREKEERVRDAERRAQEAQQIVNEIRERNTQAARWKQRMGISGDANMPEPHIVSVKDVMPVSEVELVRVGKNKRRHGEPAWGLQAVGASRSPYTGKGTVVAVLGTGIQADHPAFRGVELVLKNFTNEVENDISGHSTHTAGTIFGRDLEGHAIGVAPGVQRALIGKVLGDGGGDEASVLEGLNWVLAEGADVVCLSIGIDYAAFADNMVNKMGFPLTQSVSITLAKYRQALRFYNVIGHFGNAFGADALMVAAAGNESMGPSQMHEITSPIALASEVLSVGAVGREGEADNADAEPYQICTFSNINPTFYAPGRDVLSARLNGGLTSFTGTSMACAVAAGVAALWWEALRAQNPNASVTAEMVSVAMKAATRSEVIKDAGSAEFGAGMVTAPL